jgi:hypothetical protein
MVLALYFESLLFRIAAITLVAYAVAKDVPENVE